MRINHAARAIVGAIVVTAGAVLLSGCSVFGGSGDGSSSGSSGSSSGSKEPVQLADDGSVKNSLGSLTRRYGEYDVTLDVLRIARIGRVIRAEFAITPRSRGATSKLSPYVLGSGDVSGVYLLDEAGLRKYPVLTSSDDKCICSRSLDSFTLDQPTVLFADFPAAPESVTSLTLVAPQIGPLPAVEVE